MRVSRWGNSLAVRIPRTMADQAQIELAHAYTLDELLDQVTPENRHDEVDWGEPMGDEVW